MKEGGSSDASGRVSPVLHAVYGSRKSHVCDLSRAQMVGIRSVRRVPDWCRGVSGRHGSLAYLIDKEGISSLTGADIYTCVCVYPRSKHEDRQGTCCWNGIWDERNTQDTLATKARTRALESHSTGPASRNAMLRGAFSSDHISSELSTRNRGNFDFWTRPADVGILYLHDRHGMGNPPWIMPSCLWD